MTFNARQWVILIAGPTELFAIGIVLGNQVADPKATTGDWLKTGAFVAFGIALLIVAAVRFQGLNTLPSQGGPRSRFWLQLVVLLLSVLTGMAIVLVGHSWRLPA
jgi:hypothetical protein